MDFLSKKNKKMLLIFPPQWTPVSPHYALAALIGQLKAKGYSAKAVDLNVEFYSEILTKDYLNFINEKIKKDYVRLFTNIRKIYTKGKKADKYSLDEQCEIYKFGKIKKFISSDDTYYTRVPNTIQFALEVIRSKERFFQPVNLIKAMNIVDYALNLISIAYAPLNLEFEACYHSFMKLDFEHIKHFVFHKESNIFWDFFKKRLDEIKTENASFIAISLNSSSQLIAGLTLTYLLKKYTKAHINIGGNFFGRIKEEVMKHPEMSMFCDSISIEEGEGPIIEMAKYINDEIPIEKVPNLIYFKNKKAYLTEKMTPVKLNEMANLNLDDYALDKYFCPNIVLPYQTSRGCYWGKCTFCDQDFGQEFNVKSIDKVIQEIKEIKEKYDINHFELIDESVSPTYLKDLSEKIIKTNINPKFFCDARLETAFDEATLKLAGKAGLKMVMWGLESGSKKIMESINKGIDLEKRFDILKLANKYGIWNFAFIFFGYPLETKDDARETIKMIANHNDIINSYGRSVFTMGKHSKIAVSPEEFGITKILKQKEEFSPSIDFECIGMSKKELDEIIEECKQTSLIHYKNPLWMYLRYREWLFLYIDKFGLDWVSNYTVKM